MSKDFIPKADADLLLWAKANSAKLTATPTVFGATALIATTYAGYVSAFETKLAAARAENAGRVDRIAKDQAREDLVTYARAWARLVQGQMTLTTAQRGELGLNLRDKPGTPINPPVDPPVVTVTEAIGRTMRLKVRGMDSAGRSKPSGASSCVVFAAVSPTAPSEPGAYKFQGLVTRGNFELQVDADVPAGSRIWICAAWSSPRGQLSPLSDPISAYIAGGIAAAAEQTFTPAQTPALKAA